MRRAIIILLPVLACLASCERRPAHDGPGARTPTPAKSTPSLDADGLPMFRAGLWEVTTRGPDGTEVNRECRAAGLDAATREFLTATAADGCEVTRSGRENGVRVSRKCMQDGVKVELSLAVEGSAERSVVRMESAVTAADGSRAAEVSTDEARWLSDCPTGVSPGDVVE